MAARRFGSRSIPVSAGRWALTCWLCLAGGCAARQPPTLTDRFIRHAKGKASEASASATFDLPDAPKSASAAAQPAAPGLHDPVPLNLSDAPSVETQDTALSDALAALSAVPSGSAHRRVAAEYRRLGIFDEAYDHFMSAIHIDRRDAAAYDGLARLWRDAGFLPRSLTEASRAVFFAPESAQAHNTLGTVLFALDDSREAQRQFEIALALDPQAAYVQNNLCYLSFVRGDLPRALEQCGEAVRLAPDLTVARNNLAAVSAAVRK